MTQTSETEAVKPWTEDGEDYGRDLGTGAHGPNGEEPEHSVQTPRDNPDDDSPVVVEKVVVPDLPPLFGSTAQGISGGSGPSGENNEGNT